MYLGKIKKGLEPLRGGQLLSARQIHLVAQLRLELQVAHRVVLDVVDVVAVKVPVLLLGVRRQHLEAGEALEAELGGEPRTRVDGRVPRVSRVVVVVDVAEERILGVLGDPGLVGRDLAIARTRGLKGK